MDNVAVYPREKDIQLSKKLDDFVDIENEEEEREAAQMHGDQYHFVRLQLYGDLYYDFSNRLGEFACRHDLDPAFLDIKKFFPAAKSEQEL